jgi:glycosyltransferase involved in cell wall biosynthesis
MLISIIIPVYNTSLYLKRCLNSVLAQNYTDFELLLVNDGSRDDSLKICREYEKKDERIKVFDKPNGGVSSARNVGIRCSSGKWICFIDSDDYVTDNHIEKLVSDIGGDFDFIMHGKYGARKASYSSYTYRTVDIDDRQELFEEFKISPNGQIFSKFFCNAVLKKYDIRFPCGVNMSEDVLFILEYLSKVKKLKYRDMITYKYTTNKGSLSNAKVFDYQSNYAGFKKINNLLYSDFNLSALNTFTHLKRTYLNFLLRAIHALNSNGYSKSERIEEYKELYSCLKFKEISVNHRGRRLELICKLFLNRRFKCFDLFINDDSDRGTLYRIYRSVN